MKLFPFMFLTFFILYQSCTSSKTAIAQKPGNSPNSDSLFFSLERTPCFGKCPVFKINIYQNGYATLEAIRNVGDKNGFYQTAFTPEDLKSISDKAVEIKYFEMENIYDSPVTDLPTVITSLNYNGRLKTIQNRHQGPPELRQFEKFVQELADGKDWTKTEEKTDK